MEQDLFKILGNFQEFLNYSYYTDHVLIVEGEERKKSRPDRTLASRITKSPVRDLGLTTSLT